MTADLFDINLFVFSEWMLRTNYQNQNVVLERQKIGNIVINAITVIIPILSINVLKIALKQIVRFVAIIFLTVMTKFQF